MKKNILWQKKKKNEKQKNKTTHAFSSVNYLIFGVHGNRTSAPTVKFC